MILYEKEIIEYVKNTPHISSAWLGGSKATQREDDLSDIDLVLVTSNANKTFDDLEIFLKTLRPIELIHTEKKRLNYHQRFYVLKDTPETFYLDVCVFESHESKDYAEYFNEKRHGLPYIIKDDGLLLEASKIVSTSAIELEKSLFKGRSEIYYRTFLKEAIRERYIDAYHFYFGLLQTYVNLLRVRYCPEKHDFSLRYLYIDLDPRHAKIVETSLKVSSLAEMKEKAAKIKFLIDEELS